MKVNKSAPLLLLLVSLSEAQENAANNLRRAEALDFDFDLTDTLPKIGSFLSDLWQQSAEGVAAGLSGGFFERDYESLSGLLSVSDDVVPIDIVGADVDKLVADAGSLGFETSAVCGGMASGAIPISALKDLSDLESLAIAYPVLAYAAETPKGEVHSTMVKDEVSLLGETPTQPGFGSVLSEGIFPLNARRIVMENQRNVDGHGITVGVISDSYDRLKDVDLTARTAADDIASEDLPSAHHILVIRDDLDNNPTDSGRAMMQIVHDLAPQARFTFHTSAGGQCVLANGIKVLSEFSDIIVNGAFYLNEPFFQDGKIAQAVDAAFDKGVTYFSAAGDFNRDSYQGPFSSSGFRGPVGGVLHNFDPNGNDPRQDILLQPGAAIVVNWDQPYAQVEGSLGSESDVNVYVLRGSSLLARGTVNNVGGDPIEILLPNLAEPTVAQLLIEFVRGPVPQVVKVVMIGGEFLEYQTFSSTVFGQANAFGGASVGANFWRETPYFGFPDNLIQPFSSVGGTPILFDGAGMPEKLPIVRQQPLVVGPDGVSNTFFGVDIAPFPFPFYFGTAAAASHVAGVAALILDKAIDKKKKLYPEDVFKILRKTATDMDDPFTPEFDVGFDFGTGYGFVNAWKALDKISGYKPIGRKKTDSEKKEKIEKPVGKKGRKGD